MVASGREGLLAVTLLVVGGVSTMYLVVEARYEAAARTGAGVALVLLGYGTRLTDTLGFLPDLLVAGVDDEDAVATMLGLVGMLVGGILVLLPASNVLDLRTTWVLSLFALLLLVLLVLDVVTTLSLES